MLLLLLMILGLGVRGVGDWASILLGWISCCLRWIRGLVRTLLLLLLLLLVMRGGGGSGGGGGVGVGHRGLTLGGRECVSGLGR